MEEDLWLDLLDKTYDAVMKYARIEFESLTRRAIYALQRSEASGIYGDGYQFKTLWDEWCHEVQEGPHDLLDQAWNKTLSSVFQPFVDRIPAHESELLATYAARELDIPDWWQWNTVQGEGTDSIMQLLEEMAASIAGDRNIGHLTS